MSTKIEQVGGTHYSTLGISHWDLMERHDVAYLEATATKYIVRWDRKGQPRLDLGKAISYLRKVLAEGRGVRRPVPLDDLAQYCLDDQLDDVKRGLLLLILDPKLGQARHLHSAVEMLENMLKREQALDV